MRVISSKYVSSCLYRLEDPPMKAGNMFQEKSSKSVRVKRSTCMRRSCELRADFLYKGLIRESICSSLETISQPSVDVLVLQPPDRILARTARSGLFCLSWIIPPSRAEKIPMVGVFTR